MAASGWTARRTRSRRRTSRRSGSFRRLRFASGSSRWGPLPPGRPAPDPASRLARSRLEIYTAPSAPCSSASILPTISSSAFLHSGLQTDSAWTRLIRFCRSRSRRDAPENEPPGWIAPVVAIVVDEDEMPEKLRSAASGDGRENRRARQGLPAGSGVPGKIGQELLPARECAKRREDLGGSAGIGVHGSRGASGLPADGARKKTPVFRTRGRFLPQTSSGVPGAFCRREEGRRPSRPLPFPRRPRESPASFRRPRPTSRPCPRCPPEPCRESRPPSRRRRGPPRTCGRSARPGNPASLQGSSRSSPR